MEHLIRRARRADQVVVDLAQRHGVEDRLAGRALAPGGVVDQEPALCLRVTHSHPAEELAAGSVAERVAREDQCHLLFGIGQPGELRCRLRRRAGADDAIAPLVAIAQFALDVQKRALAFVDREDDGPGHAPNRNPSRMWRVGQSVKAGAAPLSAGAFAMVAPGPAARPPFAFLQLF